MRRIAPILLLAGCGAQDRAAEGDGAGARLERAARAAGLVEDAARIDPVGVFATATDRVCIVRAADTMTIGAVVDYGEGQGCTARGSVRGRSELAVDLGGRCRFDARLEGGRLTFPPVLPASCDRVCSGRASLAGLTADRLSASASEAASARGLDGQPLCAA